MESENQLQRPSCSPPKIPPRSTESSGATRTQIQLDDETLQRMMESFGPLEYSEFAATVSPHVLEHLVGQGFSQRHWSEDYQQQEPPARRKSKSPRAEVPSGPDPRYALSQSEEEEEISTPDPRAEEAKKQTLLQWFDKSVEKELRKRREPETQATSMVDPALSPLKAKHALNLSKGTVERIAEASASRIEIAADLEAKFTTELSDAVEKLAKAETMCSYAEALQAAEEAAQNAPPELMEQAAAEGARRIQTDVTKVKETIPGIRPIEVVGYVGVTKPYHPKKSK